MDTRKSMFAFLKDTFTDEKAEKIFYYGKRLNAKDFLDHADRVAGFLTSVGIKKGDFIDIKDGHKWGEHTGTYQYTIGQRKGIGIAAPYPLYVIDIDAEKNIVYLGREEDNYKTKLSVTDVNLTYPDCPQEFDAMVKIRYNMQAQKAHIKLNGTNADIEFYAPANSITKGQAGVFYDINDGHLIGGGWVN